MSIATTHIKTDKQLVPALRFKEFEGQYSKRILKDFTKINQGLQIPISERYSKQVEGSYFYITNEFLRKDSKKSYFIKNPTESVICFEDDILMTRTGNTGQVVTGVHGAFHNNFFKIKFDESCEKWYLYFFLTSYITQHKILTLAGTSTIPDLNHGDFYKLKITMPKYPEQQKIASFLTAVDKKIQQLSKKKTLLAQYKKGVMQQLFSGKLRFKDENGKNYPDWEDRNLNYYLKVSKTKNFDLKYNKNDVLSVSGEFGIVNQIEFQGRSFAGASVHNYGLVENGDIVYTKSPLKSNPYGIIKINKDKPGIVSTLYAVYKCKPTLIGSYLDYYFQLDDNTNRYLRPLVQKGSKNDMKINNEKVLIDPILIPSTTEEQKKVVDYLEELDYKIAIANNQLTQTLNFKKGLLQQMFV